MKKKNREEMEKAIMKAHKEEDKKLFQELFDREEEEKRKKEREEQCITYDPEIDEAIYDKEKDYKLRTIEEIEEEYSAISGVKIKKNNTTKERIELLRKVLKRIEKICDRENIEIEKGSIPKPSKNLLTLLKKNSLFMYVSDISQFNKLCNEAGFKFDSGVGRPSVKELEIWKQIRKFEKEILEDHC